MICRVLDGNDDWSFGRSKQDYLTGNSAIAQCIVTRLRCWYNDCFFDMLDGIDWLFYLGGSKSTLALELSISSRIINSYGVLALNKISMTLDANRNFSISYGVQSILTGSISNTIFLLTDENGNIFIDENGNQFVA